MDGTIKLSTDTISEKLLLVIVAVANHPGMRRPELCKLLDITLSTIKRILNIISIPPVKLIEFRGAFKSGGYYLTDFGVKILTKIASEYLTEI